MNLLSYLLRRLVGFAAVLIGVSIITFGLSHLVPTDPAVVALGDHATDEQIDAFREKYGLNKPVPEQYWIYVTNLLHGDLGISLRTRRPVAADLHDFFPATFELSLTALILSILIGLPAGVVSATARNRLPDHVVRDRRRAISVGLARFRSVRRVAAETTLEVRRTVLDDGGPRHGCS